MPGKMGVEATLPHPDSVAQDTRTWVGKRPRLV
jgi:hypothetical protein